MRAGGGEFVYFSHQHFLFAFQLSCFTTTWYPSFYPLAIYHRLVWRSQIWVPHKDTHTFHPTSHQRRDWRDETQHAMPTAGKCIGGGSLDVVPQSYHASAALKTFPFVFYLALLFYPLFFSFNSRGLPSGLCRSNWQAPFKAFQSCSSPHDCALLPWLCSVNNSPPASLLPPSSFCSSLLSVYFCARGGCMFVCEGEWESNRESKRETVRKGEWIGEKMWRML